MADHAPSDDTTLTGVLAEYAEAGYDQELRITEDGDVVLDDPPTTFDPDDIHLDSLRRLEGASDPDDMVAVAAVSARDGAIRGTLVMHFGPGASEGEAHVLARLNDRRTDSDLPAARTPDEGSTTG